MQDPSQVAQGNSPEKHVSWASNIPQPAGLYHPDNEKDACGVGFIVSIRGLASHSILGDARALLCNMTHRGAVGSDARDGDGAGVMCSIPDKLFRTELSAQNVFLPPLGTYAVGNVYLSPDDQVRKESKATFEEIAHTLGLKVLAWRLLPRDNTILGPTAASKEPVIEQPFVVLANDEDIHQTDFDAASFNKALYLLRKRSTHKIGLDKWFYVCSLSNTIIIYKGQLAPVQVYRYFDDLTNPIFETHFALVHSRFSTNTFPSWDRAQPMRFCAHNGEINTLRGNQNYMRSREGTMESSYFKKGTPNDIHAIESLYPIIEPGGSDSAAFDNVLELLLMNGYELPEAVMMMIPEAWQGHRGMEAWKKAFYEWASCLMEPWDGPALFTFSDGRYVGASLDRNGLRPCRFYITSDDRMICASEVGAIQVPPETIVQKGRLQPGKIVLVDTLEGRVVDDTELKKRVCSKHPFQEWLKNENLRMEKVGQVLAGELNQDPMSMLDATTLNEDKRLAAFGFTLEQLNMIVTPMVKAGKEPLGSMGTDTPLACLSKQPRIIYEYFRQLFAQVTNPPIDPIREEIVMSLGCYVGPEGNLLEVKSNQCHRLWLDAPILSERELELMKNLHRVYPGWTSVTLDITYDKQLGIQGYLQHLHRICKEAEEAIEAGYKIAVLSDKQVGDYKVPVSAAVALGAVTHHLVKKKLRNRIALVVETGEAREVHHFCVLLGYGADAIVPYLAFESMLKLHRENLLPDLTPEEIIVNFKKASNNGILKVMSKMGISTLQSYKGAQIFEALGLAPEVVEMCFEGTASRIKGIGFDILALDALTLHERAYPTRDTILPPAIAEGGDYHWRSGGEPHINDPTAIAHLQDAVRRKNENAYQEYSRKCYEQIKDCTLRGLLDFRKDNLQPVPLDEVESWTSIVKRFVTGAMSYGSISMEAHSTLALAMNKIGAKSNTGEGGEDPARSSPLPNGDSMRSAIKQVASARFGVTSYYLSDADELQIKIAQGAKPGEGGELAGSKVSASIAFTRKSTPGVGLISPPPHHDIYSIEDLKQLIYDLKCSNPNARVSVKLVSEVGVGVIASGVAKAKADHILISGHDGGTGASRWTGIRYAGLPWELGLAESHQTLVLNDLRGRVVLQTDGQIRTGRDVAIACLLGAEEWGFATTPLIAMGCTMMRKCHLNTCPVGIATQDPELRKKFEGKPEHVINFFYYVAEELRSIMASLGFRYISEMVGRTDMLVVPESAKNIKTRSLDLTAILTPAFRLRPGVATHCVMRQEHALETRKDNMLIEKASPALVHQSPVVIETDIVNTDRAFASTLSYYVSKRRGESGLPQDTILVKIRGSAGQSFGAFLAPGITLELEGDANDYVGKGLSGGRIIVYPPKNSLFRSEENVIVGNVCAYGATSGEMFIRGIAAERFCVRNSGAIAVVEGVGDHGCEYMTGGRVVVLGSTGRNFAAGMSGGIAYVLDVKSEFHEKCNMELVDLEAVVEDENVSELHHLIESHWRNTGSELAQRVLNHWANYLPKFVKVMPRDYRRVLQEAKASRVPAKQGAAEEAKKTELNIASAAESQSPATVALVDVEDSIVDGEMSAKKPKVLDKVRGFMKYKRQGDVYRPAKRRIKDWEEINSRLPVPALKEQAARCMDCGVPFCQSATGCPLGNIIPKWNDLVFKEQWYDALQRLLMTNPYPEFTGRVCPAPCEGACVLGISEKPVSIKSIECAIIDRAFAEGWMNPQVPETRTGKRVAIIGSGPTGLAAAEALNKAGHFVTVYEREDRIGGLLMYGIPNMKLDKKLVQRRVDLLEAEGVKFVTGAHVGKNVDPEDLMDENDAVLVAIGSTWPRDLTIPNRELDGIHFAMEFLTKNTKNVIDSAFGNYISAKDKDVIVIGGGDTGNDCIGTSVRHGCRSVVNFELLPEPPVSRAPDNPWPQFPRVFKVDYGHEEVQVVHGKDPREYCVLSKSFVSDGHGRVAGINTVKVEWQKDAQGRWQMTEIPGSEKYYKADLVLLAMGFVGPEYDLIKQLQIVKNARTGTITTEPNKYATNVNKVFAAGDCRRGQSLVVWGINEGRQAAREIDIYLMGHTRLPVSGGHDHRDLESNHVTELLAAGAY